MKNLRTEKHRSSWEKKHSVDSTDRQVAQTWVRIPNTDADPRVGFSKIQNLRYGGTDQGLDTSARIQLKKIKITKVEL